MTWSVTLKETWLWLFHKLCCNSIVILECKPIGTAYNQSWYIQGVQIDLFRKERSILIYDPTEQWKYPFIIYQKGTTRIPYYFRPAVAWESCSLNMNIECTKLSEHSLVKLPCVRCAQRAVIKAEIEWDNRCLVLLVEQFILCMCKSSAFIALNENEPIWLISSSLDYLTSEKNPAVFLLKHFFCQNNGVGFCYE